MAPNTTETARVLVVSRDSSLLRPLWSLGEPNCFCVETATSGWEAMERIQSDVAPHLLLVDVPRGDGDVLHMMRWLRRLHPALPVVAICHAEDAAKAKEATRLGVQETLLRPFDEEQLESLILRNLEASNCNEEVHISSDDVESVGEDEFFLSASPVMQKLRAQAELLAQADVPVLILGEPGSGKGTVARLIHKLSVHSGFSFVRVNCAEMPAELLEAELFGTAHSAGNGNGQTRTGKLSQQEKGTLFLEEITEMSLGAQGRLLQILQQKHGGQGETENGQANVRVLVSSSVRPDQALAQGRLREDLYYRLSAFTVHVPPLRQRREEIPVLLQYSMHKLARHYGLQPREFTPSVLQACTRHSWPGNLLEVETFVKRYLLAGDQEALFGSLEINTFAEQKVLVSRQNQNGESARSLKSLIQSVKSETEKNAIAAALEKTGWNRKAAARLLNVSYRSVLYKIDQYQISPNDTYLSSEGAVRSSNRGNGKIV